ncbi:MAG: hypothetical protein Q8Q23_04685 [bacterium]|nr:hypothetical protein [bacterium]
MENLSLIEDEEKALIGILYNHLSFSTTLEVFGELTSEGVQRVNALRHAFATLLQKYNLSGQVDEQTYLLLGLVSFIKQETLQAWAANEDNKHLQNRAKYFLKKN